MAAPLVGRRVRISGLTAKPELNGQHGIAASFDDAKGRYNIKLESSGDFIALKPGSLSAADEGAGAAGAAGGMPGFGGGMPGFGGGMPGFGAGGFPGGGHGAAGAMLQQLLAKLMGGGGVPGLPAGVSPAHVAGGAMLVLFVLPRLLGIGMLQAALVGGLGGYVLIGAANGNGAGGVRANGKKLVSGFGQLVRRVSGRPVSDAQALLFLAALLYLIWKYVLSSGDTAGGGWLGGGGGDEFEESARAYTKGYADGRDGKKFDPVIDAPPKGSKASSWGIGSLFNLAMAGSMVYQWGCPGGAPFSVEALVANARQASPMQLMILFQIVSSLLF